MTTLRPQPMIRNAERSDLARILELIHALAVYEKEPHAVVATANDLDQALFSDRPKAYALMCDLNGINVGFALYFYNFSTWRGKHGIFLEDLFIEPEYRGQGAGLALLRYLARQAVAEGCERFEWNVLDWNTPSIQFYESVGAVAMSEWIGYRLHGDALHDFAAG
ncbi:MAG: GNAT family N-acetyltransferase [Proteobacteria bacterium]|nr:GNAT family N-acetyltransferase [Pseudomonadota bacterium]